MPTNTFIVFKERIYKIWKQFTTISRLKLLIKILCSKNEYTKSESNSQQVQILSVNKIIVFKERIYKIWKQFTTFLTILVSSVDCVQRTNIQNLKAIHNQWTLALSGNKIVFKERIYKIWKQFTTTAAAKSVERPLCSKNEYTKSESNSQRS